jgi:uncharacterized integral membrane protein
MRTYQAAADKRLYKSTKEGNAMSIQANKDDNSCAANFNVGDDVRYLQSGKEFSKHISFILVYIVFAVFIIILDDRVETLILSNGYGPDPEFVNFIVSIISCTLLVVIVAASIDRALQLFRITKSLTRRE